jgi:hypothetical protein
LGIEAIGAKELAPPQEGLTACSCVLLSDIFNFKRYFPAKSRRLSSANILN